MNIDDSTFSGDISTFAFGLGGQGEAIINSSAGGSGYLAITNTTSAIRAMSKAGQFGVMLF